MDKTYFDFDLFRVPDADSCTERLIGKGSAGVLILTTDDLVDADHTFLDNILKAAKFDPVVDKTFQLALSKTDRIPLAQLCESKTIHTVIIFGCVLSPLGVQAKLPAYQFVRLGGIHLMVTHDLPTIRKEREQNKNQKAGLLWQALKAKFL